MKMNHYVTPKTVEEAYTLLTNQDGTQLIAGGAWMKLSSHKIIDTLIDLNPLGLNNISETKKSIIIGANVTLRDIELNPVFKGLYEGIFLEAVQGIMGVGVRNIATIGGSIMGRFSFSDLFPVLLGVDAQLEFHQHDMISLEDFLATKRFEKDILLAVHLPKKELRGFYKKVKRAALDFAILNMCILKHETFEVVVGARSGIAKKAVKTAQFLNHNTLTEDTINKAAEMLIDELSFSSNQRASKAYREDLAKVYFKRGINEVTK